VRQAQRHPHRATPPTLECSNSCNTVCMPAFASRPAAHHPCLTSEPLLLLRCLPLLLERAPAPDRCFSSSGRGTLLLAYSTARCRALGSLGLALAGAAAARRSALADLMRLLSSRTRSLASRCRRSAVQARSHTCHASSATAAMMRCHALNAS
jgi:hypothetical protein